MSTQAKPALADDVDKSIAILKPDGTLLALAQSKTPQSKTHSNNAVLPIYSLTKTFLAAAVMDCGININLPISRWFEKTLVPRGGEITVAQLLTHSSGIPDYFSASPAYSAAVLAAQQATPASNTSATETATKAPWSDEVFAEHTLRQPLIFEPGSGFSYSNPNYWLLGRILERETDCSVAEVVQEHIAKPLGLESMRWAEGIFAKDLPNYASGWVWHGLLLGSALDVARFMASPLIDALRSQPVDVPGSHPDWVRPQYGYGLMIEPGECFGHNGEGPGYSASCFHFNQSNHTLCVLRRSPNSGAPGDNEGTALQDLRALYRQITT